MVALDEIFTPHGYANEIRWRGQNVDVREPDGIHLSVQGASIAAELIEPALVARTGAVRRHRRPNAA